jgi:hypothetical protein
MLTPTDPHCRLVEKDLREMNLQRCTVDSSTGRRRWPALPAPRILLAERSDCNIEFNLQTHSLYIASKPVELKR